VGKFKKSCCIKSIKNYPREYKATKNVHISARVFRVWLPCMERKMVGKNNNILPLLDQWSAHNHRGLVHKYV
jgi:hypothetical protein